MKTVTFNNGDIIFKQGDFPQTMYHITQGCVGVYSAYGTVNEKKIAVLKQGQVLGEMGMLEIYPRSATAVAEADGTTMIEVTEADLDSYFQDKPEELLNIMKQLSKRIRETDEKYINACRALYENDEAERNGTEKSEWSRQQIASIWTECSYLML